MIRYDAQIIALRGNLALHFDEKWKNPPNSRVTAVSSHFCSSPLSSIITSERPITPTFCDPNDAPPDNTCFCCLYCVIRAFHVGEMVTFWYVLNFDKKLFWLYHKTSMGKPHFSPHLTAQTSFLFLPWQTRPDWCSWSPPNYAIWGKYWHQISQHASLAHSGALDSQWNPHL